MKDLKLSIYHNNLKKRLKKFNNKLLDLHANMNCIDAWSGVLVFETPAGHLCLPSNVNL